MSERDAERWPMSILFLAIDAISEAWERMQYSPRNVRLVSRIFLRYAMLGFAQTPNSVASDAQSKGYRYAHDEDQYCRLYRTSGSASSVSTEPMTVEREGTSIGVNPETFYGPGGAVLRDVLGDLCTVAHADTWIAHLTYDAMVSPRSCTNAIAASFSTMPLARRLFEALDTYLTEESSNDSLMGECKARPSINVMILELWTMAPMRERSERCFESFQRFLGTSEASSAESCLMKSGVSAIIQPGEVYKFMQRWPDHGTTPINVVNGLRPRDMKQYGDYVMGDEGPVKVFSCANRKGLPACLVPLIDHMGWEMARQMMRIMAIHESTESFVSFLIEPNHVRAAAASVPQSSASWERFRVWSPTSEMLADPLEETVRKMNTVVEYPPFPAIVLLHGRVFVWNPYAPYMNTDVDFDFDDGDDDDDDGDDDSEMRETLRTYLEYPLIDVSGDAMPMALYMWLVGRICLLKTLLGGENSENSDQESMRRATYPVCRQLRYTGEARLALYAALLKRWFCTNAPSTGHRRPPMQ